MTSEEEDFMQAAFGNKETRRIALLNVDNEHDFDDVYTITKETH